MQQMAGCKLTSATQKLDFEIKMDDSMKAMLDTLHQSGNQMERLPCIC